MSESTMVKGVEAVMTPAFIRKLLVGFICFLLAIIGFLAVELHTFWRKDIDELKQDIKSNAAGIKENSDGIKEISDGYQQLTESWIFCWNPDDPKLQCHK